MKTIASILFAALAASAAGCSAEVGTGPTTTDEGAATKVASTSAADTYSSLALTWQNIQTGVVSNWILAGATVTGAQSLSWQCGPSNGCTSAWSPISTEGASILWYDQTNGQLSAWDFDSSNNVTAPGALSWTCTAASGCASAWRPIGNVEINGTCSDPGPFGCPQQHGLLWHDASSGAVSLWDLTGNSVTGTQTLSWPCSASSGCSSQWRAELTADMNNDANTDVVWYDATTGQVSSWLLNGATVTGAQALSWTCTAASGCAAQWKIIGAADVNADGHTDLTWFNASTGAVSSWLLDGKGNVTGTQQFSWTCDAASGCSSAWRPLGFTRYPQQPPR